MPVSDARKRANSKWDKDNMATLGCKTKREDVEAFKKLAAQKGKTANTLLRDYVLACLSGGADAEAAPAAALRPRKLLTVVAGVEGSGKTSFLGSQWDRTPFGVIVDAEQITLACENNEELAQKKFAARMRQCVVDGVDFTVEASACESEVRKIAKQARERGYAVRLFYIGLDNVYDNLERIANRARHGGVDVPATEVRRHHAARFGTLSAFLPFCQEAAFFDNTAGFVQVGEYRNGQVLPLGERRPLWLLELIKTLREN